MKNRILHILSLFIILVSLASCETESYRTLNLNESFLNGQKPANNYSRSFGSANGDTVNVYLSENNSTFESLPGGGEIGALGGLENVNAERRSYVLRCDSPQLSFNYRFSIINNAQDNRSYSDLLEFELSDSLGSLSDALSFITQNDTIYPNSFPLFYADSLTLISNTYTEVYGPVISDPGEMRMFYIKLGQGLVGFQTRDGQLYELVN